MRMFCYLLLNDMRFQPQLGKGTHMNVCLEADACIEKAVVGYETVELALHAAAQQQEAEVTMRTEGMRGLWHVMVDARENLAQAQALLSSANLEA